MSEYKDITIESEENSGKIVFAEDVVATIATLAAAEVDGVYGMSGTAFEGIGEKAQISTSSPMSPTVRVTTCVMRLTRRNYNESWVGNRASSSKKASKKPFSGI